MSDKSGPPLDVLQRWMQAVITHVGGAEEGVMASEAQAAISIGTSEVEKVIRPSGKLTALERLSVYSNAYYARLLECLGGCFPVLKRALGDEVFDSFGIEYLQDYPSQSYTLDRLGEHFCDFLKETRPEPEDGNEDTDWPDFLIDLATLEWTIGRVFDGPGAEEHSALTAEMLTAFPAVRFPEARLATVTGLRLLSFSYPVSAYFTAIRRATENETVPIPGPKTEHVAVFRRDFVVRRYHLSKPQLLLLQQIQTGATVAEAITAAAAEMDTDDETLADSLQSWFRLWSKEGFFEAITL